MGRKKLPGKEELKHRLYTRVNDQKLEELRALLRRNPQADMSGLIRDILYNRPVRVITRDTTLDDVMEELARLRTEIRSIGVNINQITRLFNTFPEMQRKQLYARIAFKEYQAMEPKIEQLLAIISKLGKRWLSA